VASRAGASRKSLKAEALRQLAGAGDASLGEWCEFTGRAYHVRRRLSAAEESLVGPAIDVRGTAEAASRALVIRPLFGLLPPGLLEDELGDQIQ